MDLIKLVNKLTTEDVEFILRNWQAKLSVYHPGDQTSYQVDQIYLNGTFIEMIIQRETEPD